MATPSSVARRAHEPDRPAAEQRVDVDAVRPPRGRVHVVERERRAEPLSGWRSTCSSTIAQLVVLARVAERGPQEEAVELRLGQRERALLLDRVLGREHEERRRAAVA